VRLKVYQMLGGTQVPGFGVYHSGLQVFDTEYTFAGHDTNYTGQTQHRPRVSPDPQHWQFRETVVLGVTASDRAAVTAAVRALAAEWTGASYDLTSRNCNHYAGALAQRLGVRAPPAWINRVARVGQSVRNVVGDGMFQQKAGGGDAGATVGGSGDASGAVDLCASLDLGGARCLDEEGAHTVKRLLQASAPAKREKAFRDPPSYLLQNYRLAHPDDAEWSVLKPAVVEFLALWRRNNPGDAMLGLRAIRTIKKGEFITGGEMGGVIRRFDKSEKPTHARLLPGKRLFVVDASKPRDRGRRLGALINTGPAATYNCRYTYKKVRPEVLLCQALIDIDAGVELVMGYGGSFTVPKAPQ
jgi:hypothetical protein